MMTATSISTASSSDGRPPVANAVISANGLTKRFGPVQAVIDLDLQVAPGEIVGFLGPNGAGKTTTIRMLMGFIRPTSGTCSVLGGSLRTDTELKRRVGYLPGDFRCDPSMTARELFAWFGRLRGGVEKTRVNELIERFELASDRPFRALSKGNRQKVGLIQAFMNDPAVLILDEPTSGLDPLVQREFLTLLDEVASRGAAVLFSTHVLPEVERVAARVVIIRSGRVVANGPVEQLLDHARRRIELRFAEPIPPSLFDGAPGVVRAEVVGSRAILVIDGPVGPALSAALKGPRLVTVRPAGDDLEDFFLAMYGESAR